MKKVVLVLTGTYKQFKYYCQVNNIDPRNARYCCLPEHIMCYRPEDVELVMTGEFWLNPLVDSPICNDFERRYKLASKKDPRP